MTIVQLACSSWSFAAISFEDSATLIRRIGFDAIAIGGYAPGGHMRDSHVPVTRVVGQPAEAADAVTAILQRQELRAIDYFVSFAPELESRALNHPSAAVREENRCGIADVVRFCRLSGIAGITWLPGLPTAQGREKDRAIAIEELRYCVGLARDAGLRFSVEPHLGSIVEDPAVAAEVAEAVPGLTYTIDYSHVVAGGRAEAEGDALVEFAGNVHIRQAGQRQMQLPHNAGELDFPRIFGKLRERAYDGPITMEYVCVDWQGLDRVDVLTCTVEARQQFLKLLG